MASSDFYDDLEVRDPAEREAANMAALSKQVANAKARPQVSVLVMGDEFNAEWVQIDGDARVLDTPDAVDGLVEYYRCISGEHPDWDEYRQAMLDQGKSVILIEPNRWGPISKGGFPPSLFED